MQTTVDLIGTVPLFEQLDTDLRARLDAITTVVSVAPDAVLSRQGAMPEALHVLLDGQVALDGEGDNSPFAVAVLQRIATPGVEINKLFRLVRDDVMEATAGRQEPYTYGSLPGKEDFFFVTKNK